MKENIVYICFYLAGDCIFKCQKSWLPMPQDIDLKRADLADLNGVNTSLITTSEEVMEVPIITSPSLIDRLLDGTGVVISKDRN